MNKLGFVVTSLIVLLAVASSMLFVVDQRQFGVVYQLGQIKQVVTEPGLNFKLPPPFQNVTDWYVRWRISDPQAYIRNVGTNERAGALQLNRVVRNAFQQEVNKRTLRELLATHREELMREVQRGVVAAVQSANQPWGMEVVDVRINRVDYAESIVSSVYQRMEAERKRVANELRSTGYAEGEAIRADADRQREVIVAEAYRDAQRIKGEGDAAAAASFAEAFGRDPAFAQFYRSLEAYKASFTGRNDVMVVDPSTDFFRALRSPSAATQR